MTAENFKVLVNVNELNGLQVADIESWAEDLGVHLDALT